MVLQNQGPKEPGWGQKLAYVAASVTQGAFNMIFMAMLMIYYSPPGGSERPELLPILVTGPVLLIGRVVDALVDPFIAYYSDRTKSRWGRRIPWIVAGLPLLLLFFIGMWAVPDSLRASGSVSKAPELSRHERLSCRANIAKARGDAKNPKAGWFETVRTESWYKKCRYMVAEAQRDTERKLCIRELDGYKEQVKSTNADWQKLVPKDSQCQALGKGCPLIPASHIQKQMDNEKGPKGSFGDLIGKHWKVALWLLVMSVGFWVAFSIVFVPYTALMPTVAVSAQARMSVNLLNAIGQIMGILLLQELLRKYFANSLGYVDMSIPYFAAVGLIGVVMVALTPLFVKEPVEEYTEDHDYGIWDSVKWSLTNKAFLIYCISTLFLMIGFNTILGSVEYLVPLLLHKEASQMMIQVYGIIMGSIIFHFGIMIWLSKRMDKRIIYNVSLFVMAAVIPLMYLLGNQSVMGIDTINFARGLFFLIGLPVAGVMSLQRTIIADIIDDDECNKGLRREAMFFGSESLVTKVVASVVPFLQSTLFVAYGYCHPLHQSHFGVRYLGPAAAVFVLAGALLFLFYPLREKELAKRRQKYFEEKGGFTESSS